ncbi:MAG: hypothetical protein LBH92_07220 [Bacteroidales bacterium]|jgi:predicted small secreted protein|nr:hypothetical protein [Bacteroidales bacterium]
MKKLYIIFLLLSAIFLSGCKSTQLVNVWRDADANQEYHNLAVIAFINDDNARTVIEQKIVNIFENSGVKMMKANAIVHESDYVSPEVIEQALKDKGIDGVLILRPVGVDKDVTVNSGVYAVYPGWNGFFYGGYYPPSVYTTTTFKIQNELYDIATDKMIWSAQTNTMDPEDIQTMGEEIGDAVFYSLRDNGLIIVPDRKE